jgi:hypothetical protein
MRDNIAFFIVGVIYVAIVYSLVRPGSTGATLVKTVTGTFADLVRGVSGQTYNPSTQAWSAGA